MTFDLSFIATQSQQSNGGWATKTLRAVFRLRLRERIKNQLRKREQFGAACAPRPGLAASRNAY
jgi:hypothetical protein